MNLKETDNNIITLPKVPNIHWIPIATEEFGWNVKYNRPAIRSETYYNYSDVCLCEYCCSDPHYGSHYCKRYGESNIRFYSDHKSRW